MTYKKSWCREFQPPFLFKGKQVITHLDAKDFFFFPFKVGLCGTNNILPVADDSTAPVKRNSLIVWMTRWFPFFFSFFFLIPNIETFSHSGDVCFALHAAAACYSSSGAALASLNTVLWETEDDALFSSFLKWNVVKNFSYNSNPDSLLTNHPGQS